MVKMLLCLYSESTFQEHVNSEISSPLLEKYLEEQSVVLIQFSCWHIQEYLDKRKKQSFLIGGYLILLYPLPPHMFLPLKWESMWKLSVFPFNMAAFFLQYSGWYGDTLLSHVLSFPVVCRARLLRRLLNISPNPASFDCFSALPLHPRLSSRFTGWLSFHCPQYATL